MGPETLKLYAARPDLREMLASAQHWVVDAAMVRTADDAFRQISEEISPDERTFEISEDAYVLQFSLPADNVVLEMSFPQVTLISHFVRDARDGRIAVSQGSCRHFEFCGIFTPRSLDWELPPQGFVADGGQVLSVTLMADLILAWAAEPRLVRKVAPVRQQRRKVQRALGFVPAAWANISWTLGEPVTPERNSAAPGEGGRALHVVRAHWVAMDRQTPKGERRPGKPGWWIWKAHFFRGHPAFGVRLQRYVPKLGAASGPLIEDVKAAATRHARAAALKAWEAANG